MRSLGKVLSIIRKDVISEMRTKEIIFSVLLFTLLVINIFNFAFGGSQENIELVAPGILWATFTFAGVLGLQRAFVPEKEQGCLEGLMICPMGRETIYFGKLLGSLFFLLIVEAIALLVFTFLFNVSVLSLKFVVITLMTTIGFVAIGTLFSALAVNTKAREMILPILFFPAILPILISAVQASALALSDEPWSALASWLQTIGVFDIVFLGVSYIIFDFVLEE